MVAWGIAIVYSAFTHDLPSATVGWLMLATLAGSGVLAVAATALSGWPVAVLGAGLTAVLCAWLLALGLDLFGRA